MESRKTYSYIKDELVIELVKMQIQLLEKDEKSWIIEGFPRTRVSPTSRTNILQLQALALQKMGILPDKFILLQIDEETSIEKVRRNLKNEEQPIKFESADFERIARNAVHEYNT